MKRNLTYGFPSRGNLKRSRRFLQFSIVLLFGLVLSVSAESNSQAKKENSRDDAAVTQQEKTITGTVTDSDGVPLPGVNIVVANTTIGTITDLDGNFELRVPENTETVVISFIGMETQEVSIVGRTSLSIVLEVGTVGIEEVVAIGYGSQRRADITGAVGSVSSEDFNQGVNTNPGQLLQGKVSGVSVTGTNGAPGGGQQIIIRGQGTIRSGSGPLFVIDGFPIGLGGTGGDYDPLNFINPEDIESMDVLKDASATAIYGSRGANGVILITTKKGSAGASMAPTVSISANLGMSTMAKKLPVFSADEFRQQVVAIGGNLTDNGGNTDWQDELSRTGITQDYNLVMSGGSNNFTYRASLGYLDQEGVVINTGFKRYSGRVNANQKFMDGRLNIDFNLNSTLEDRENADLKTVTAHMLTFNPTYPAYTDGQPTNYADLLNPITQSELFKDFDERRRTIVNIAPSIEIINGLVYKLNIGFQKTSGQLDEQEMPSADPYVEGYLRQRISNGTNTLVENYLTYTADFNDHSLILLGGHSYQKTQNRWSRWNIENFEATGIEPRFNPGLGNRMDLSTNRPEGQAQENELQSFFGRATYHYQGKYMVTGTIRADGSSKFGANNKYGTFPSFAAAWRISQESFMGSSPFSNLKLRAGWGQTGNQEIPNKITQEAFQSSTGGDDTYPLFPTGPYPVGTVYTRLANPDIQWEVSTQTNVGLDFGFLGGALSGTIDYFHKVSENILVEVPAFDPVSPAPTYWTNVPDMTITNDGLEVALDFQHMNTAGFSYALGANMTYIKNVVNDSPFNVLTTGSVSGTGQTGATINGMINGHPIGSFYLQEFLGIDPSSGQSIYKDPPVPDGDNRYVVGKALPDLMYNLYANLGYKGFDLSMNFNGVSGVEIFNHTALQEFSKPQLASSRNTTAFAVEYPDEAITNAPLVSTRYLENGSFFRLNNLTLGYTFNTNNLDWLKRLRLSFTGQNLFVITEYTGYDPEVNQDKSIGGVQSFGIDHQSYPRARTFVFGLNVAF